LVSGSVEVRASPRLSFGNKYEIATRHTPYSILDDETFVVMEEDQALYIPSMGKGCGLISHVTDPVLVRKSGKMFGFWTRDNGDLDHKSVFVMEHFYKNTKMDKYRSMSGNDTNFASSG